ncbi:HNH endonuclease [Shinella zoogloeoides]|uniref:HNH endonuclease n=1 Tax=Shinella zoogloeoides TaxID=352475 RepID=UPI001F59D038|nr:HNH endonuclease [Shinella zoogloeoides]
MSDLSSLIADQWQPIETAEVPLTLGQVCIIDLSDLPFVQRFKWHARPRRDGLGFYAANSSGQRMHRLLLEAGQDEVVDHKDGDGLNNRRANLRKGTQSQNCVNRRQTPGANPRGTRLKKGKWQAYIKFRGKQHSLGYFDTAEQAHEAYVREATRLHGDWMPLPSPPRALDQKGSSNG